MQLSGKTVLITGAASGIGRETARHAHAQGAKLLLLDREAEGLHAAAAEFPTADVHTAVVDVTRAGDVAQAIGELWALSGGIDVVLSAAGILRLGTHDHMTTEDVAASMLVNFYGALHVMQSVLPLMKQRGRGHVINMGSMAALRGMAHLGAYSATKFAVLGLSQAIRDELHGSGVAISVVCPPSIRTPMVTGQSYLPPIYQKFAWLEPADVARTILKAIKSRRFLVLVDVQSHLLVWVLRLLPGLADKLMVKWNT